MDAGFACGRVFNAEDMNRDGENLWSAAFSGQRNTISIEKTSLL